MLHWCREREAIRLRRAAGEPAPWTQDEILLRFRFCNLRREDDRVTQWIRECISEPYVYNPNLWFMLALARHINWPPTIQELMDLGLWPEKEYHSSDVVIALRDRSARGEKVFTSAYMLNNRSVPAGVDKAQCVAGTVLSRLWDRHLEIAAYLETPWRTLRGTHELLSETNGIGPFMAYQICVDMRWTRYLRTAPDINTWAAAGPGTRQGLNYLHGRSVHYGLNQTHALAELLPLRAALASEGIDLELSDCTNVLCETAKYLRVQRGEGRPRSQFRPGEGDF